MHTFIQMYRISKGQCSELRRENAREFTESLQQSDRISEAYNHGIHSNLWCVKKMTYVPPQLLLESIEM